MTSSATLSRCVTALAAAALVAGVGASTAVARVDPGEAAESTVTRSGCSVQLVAGHLVRCDNLTGGVALR